MVTTRADSYSVASGGTVYAGSTPPQVSARTALLGDSLTTHLLGYNWAPAFWINGLAAGGGLQIVANAGINGNTVADMLARVDNAYTAATPGLAGLGTLGRIIWRGGTNDARAAQTWAAISGTVSALLDKLKGYCVGKVIILSVPPVGPTESDYAAINTRTIAYNVGLAALAAADPTRLLFIDDSAGLRDVDGSQLAGYFNADGIHNDGRATWKEGVDGAALLAAELAGYPSPLSTDAADVYPAQPQWVPNHVMAGAGPTATGWSIGGYGSGFTVGTSIVAADAEDPNQTPWQRVTPTAIGYAGMGESVLITSALSGRSVTNVDPVAFDIMCELRFNAFDASKFKWARINVYSVADSQPITHDLDLKMGGETITHDSVVLRHAMPRSTMNNEASGVSLRFEFATRSAYTGSMGSFDFRCATVRG